LDFIIIIWSQSYQKKFLRKQRILPFFGTKLGCFAVSTFFSYATNSRAYQRKSENGKNKSFVGSAPAFSLKHRAVLFFLVAISQYVSAKADLTFP